MKKFTVCMLIFAILATLTVLFFDGKEQTEEVESESYLRIHIRANSNSEQDQSVKYLVRDSVVEYLTPLVAECTSKEEAMRTVESHLSEIVSVADTVLAAQGYSYGARASLRTETFPTRVYDSVTLQAGVYDALIVELGTGTGDNWWCVVYPPLCFTGSGNVVYQSKIMELIRKWFYKQ